jgi:S1-C subfamily serine protease
MAPASPRLHQPQRVPTSLRRATAALPPCPATPPKRRRKRIKRLLIGLFSSMEMLQPLQVPAQNQGLFLLPGLQQALDCIACVQKAIDVPSDDSRPVSSAQKSVVTVHVSRTRSIKRIFPGARGLDAPATYELFAEPEPGGNSGSGFFTHVYAAGQRYVLTSAHNVARAADSTGSVWVETYNGQRLPAVLRFADSFYDFAILSVDSAAVAGLPAITFRRDAPRLTERVYTIGTPLGRYPSSVSDGIVSEFDRFFSDETGRFGFLQLTAPAVGGNSGGPAIDRQGRLIGMVTKVGQDLRANGIPHLTFALEGHLCERLLHDFVREGAVRRPWLGCEFAETHAESGTWLQPAVPVVRIRHVFPGQALDRATNGGCHLQGAQVLAINRSPIAHLDALYQLLDPLDPAHPIELTLLQDGDTCQVAVQADVLSNQALTLIANHFIAQQTGTLSGQLHPGHPIELAMRHSLPDQGSAWEKYRIAAAGFNTVDRSHLWEVMRPEELGAVIRLFTVHGKVQLVLIPAHTTTHSPRDFQYHTFYYAKDSAAILYH